MRCLNTGALATVLACAAACVMPPGSAPSATGRYLQMKHPASDSVIIQMTVPNPDTCALMLKAVPPNDVLLRLMSCRSDSAAAMLPMRATLRNIPYNFLVDVDAVSPEECRATVDAMMKSDGAPNLQVVAPCVRK